jgi:flagellar assembly factor FliW
MTSEAIAETATASAIMPPPGEFTVATRFGAINGHWDDAFEMPQGPLGFAKHRRFALLQIPNPKLAQFRLMQSLEDADLSFIVMPCPIEEGPIMADDLRDAANVAGMTAENLGLYVIVTVRTLGEAVELTGNLRAPVLHDPHRHVARQVVLANAAYAIRAPIGAAKSTA